MKFTILAGTALLAFAAASAAAQGAVDLSVGATIYGPQGGVVGTIKQVSNGVVVIDTGDNEAPLSTDSFTKGEKGTVIGYTKAQIDEMIDAFEREQEAKLTAAIAVGAQINSVDGVALGTIQSINEDGSVVVDQSGRTFALQRSQLGTNDSGLISLFTAAQIEEALGAAADTGSAGG
jgi:hypothetical protein